MTNITLKGSCEDQELGGCARSCLSEKELNALGPAGCALWMGGVGKEGRERGRGGGSLLDDQAPGTAILGP